MKTLQKIVSGIALAGALAFGYEANAQTKLSTETQMINNGIGSGIPLHRTVVETKPITVKYDKTTALGNNADPVDVGAVFLNDLFSNDNTNVGAYMINVGNFNRNDEQFFGAWMSKKYDDITATLEAGKGSRATGSPREFAIGYFRSPIFSGDIAYFAQGSTFGKNEIKKYAWGAYHDKHAYVKAGKKLVRLIHLGPSNFTKGEKVEFDYEVAPNRRLALNQLLHADNFLGYEGKINAQSGFIRTDGIIKMLEEWSN